MPVRFLPPDSVADELATLFANATQAKLAVSFWGAKAIEHLGLNRSDFDVMVVLNLMSGAVEPSVVDMIGRSRVRTHDALHTKIYWTDKGAIVGSCNASANGLGLANNETRDLKEAAVFLPKGSEAWEQAGTCAGDLFQSGRQITAGMLKDARRLWLPRRIARPALANVITLAKALRNDPDRLRDRNIWILIERPAEGDRPDKQERAVAKNLGITQFDRWDEHVPVDANHDPLGMTAICYDVEGKNDNNPHFSWGYNSEVQNNAAAYIGSGRNARTIGDATNNTDPLHGRLSVSYSTDDALAELQPILGWLWKNRDQNWNRYQERNKRWPSVLVSVDKIISLLPDVAESAADLD